jgi:hypothetical protein
VVSKPFLEPNLPPPILGGEDFETTSILSIPLLSFSAVLNDFTISNHALFACQHFLGSS